MIQERHYYDEAEDRTYIQRVQDVEPVINANRRAMNEFSGYKSEVFNRKASIPVTVIEEWCRVRGIKYQEFMNSKELLKRFINDPDNAAFNCIPGKI